jgi:hypothetical protein
LAKLLSALMLLVWPTAANIASATVVSTG